MFCQPGLALCVIGHRALHSQPERGGVVWLVQVGNLMHHNIFGDARRQEDGLPVEIQPVTFTARAPAITQVWA